MRMKEAFFTYRLKRILSVGFSFSHRFGNRTLLSKAYQCEEAWAKRLESPLLRGIKIDEYFLETDKKFATKNLVSGIDVDLFAISVQDKSQFDELEHLLYRFRMTKRASEMMDSTVSAVVRIFLKFKDYESLFRILQNPEGYGIFPDLFMYNVLMDTFIEEKMYREAAQVAVLMMLQEDFSNEIGRFLAVYSCHLFLKNNSLDSLYPKPVEQASEKVNEEDDDEEVLERVPFLQNPWFDDHFDLKEPRHLIGKTYFLAGRQMKDKLLGKTFELVGLGMYEKWEKALDLLNSLVQSEGPVLLNEGVEEFKKYMDTVPSEELKSQFEDLFRRMQEQNQIKDPGELENQLSSNISAFPSLEERDIKLQKELFKVWEQERQLAFEKQNKVLDRQRRLEEIAKKKEYLFWREKLLFFFENEDRVLEEFKEAEEIATQARLQVGKDETYVPPEIKQKGPTKLTKYEKAIRFKKIVVV